MTGKKRESLVVKPTDEGIKITNKNVGVNILDGFYSLWKDGLLCDVKLLCNNEEILAHRAMLLIYSDYFKAMFTIGLTESSQVMPEIQLNEASPEALKALLTYMYTGVLAVTRETVQDLVVLTDLLQMKDIKEYCCQYIESNLDATNCLGIWGFAETYGCTRLLVKTISLLKRRFPVVTQTEEFLSLSPARLQSIMHFQDLSLGNEGEDEVFRGVVRWLEHDVTERANFVKDIVKFVKLNHVSESLINEFTQIALMQDNQDITDWILEKRSNSQDDHPRQPVQCIYAVGGYLQSRTGYNSQLQKKHQRLILPRPMCPRLRTVEQYDFRDNEWKNTVESLPILASGVQVFNIHGKLFCTSFEMSHENLHVPHMSSSQGFYEYDNIQNTWKDANECFTSEASRVIHECLQKSGSIAICSKTNRIFTVSESDVHYVDTHLEDGEVLFCDPVRLPRLRQSELYSNHSAVLYNDCLYVLGGDERISASEIFPTAAVFMYDSSEESWIAKKSMQEPRARFSAVVMGDYIYAVGGFNTKRLRSVERYDPYSDTWRYVESMNKERSHFKCVVHQIKIYSMGGKSYSRFEGGARKVLSSCEVYDPETDQWTYIAPMKQARCLFGAELF